MNGVHDLGGTDGLGPVEIPDSEPEIRAFAMAVAAYDNGQYEWSEFQLSLIESIRQWEQGGQDPDAAPWSYYEHWLTALETVPATSTPTATRSRSTRPYADRPGAAEAAPVREALLHPRSRRPPDRSGADHRPDRSSSPSSPRARAGGV